MFWNRYLVPAILLAASVAILNAVADDRSYYYLFSWYDWMMHFLGGAAMAYLLAWAANAFEVSWLKPFATGRNLVFSVLFIGLAWEAFELATSLTSVSDPAYAWDTAHDLVMDVCGGAAAFLSMKYHIKKQ